MIPSDRSSTPSTKPEPTSDGWIPGAGGSTDANADGIPDDQQSSSGGKHRKSTKKCILELKYKADDAEDGEPPSTTTQTFIGKKKETVKFEDTVQDNVGFMEREGYWFCAWETRSSGGSGGGSSSRTYYPGEKVVKEWGPNHSGSYRLTLHPIWRSSGVYIYMPDEHTIEEHYSFSEKEVDVGRNLAGEIFHRTGYTLVGWATTEGGTKVYNLEELVVPDSTTVQILYPVWSANTYRVTTHANGGKGSNYILEAVFDSEFTIPEIGSNHPNLVSSDFSLDEENNLVSANFQLSTPNNILDLASWSFEAEDGLLPLYTKTGYHVDSWNESPDGSGSSWFSGVTYTYRRASDVDLYAVWVGDEYIVTYVDGLDVIHTSKAVYGSPFYTDRVPYPEDKAYYSFNGWIADDGTVLKKQGPHFDAFTYGQNPIWALQRDLTIERQWSANYPFGKILFGGEYSDQYGIFVETFPSDTWPEYEYGHHKVHGKNGDVLTDPKRFNNVSRKYKISAYDYSDYRSVSKKVSEWLHKTISSKYIRLEDSYEPDVYRLAVYEESNELENLLGTAGKCEIEFNCKPQKFLISGSEEIEITTSNKTLYNPTDRDAAPLIKIYGSGKVHINDSTLEVIQSFNNVTFDAESYDAIDFSGYNMNGYIYTEDSIVLKPGENTITTEGNIVKLFITPRWWRV